MIQLELAALDDLEIAPYAQEDGSAHAYIANNLGGVIRDTERKYNSVSFRGWAFTPNNDSAITEYGYALNTGDIVWNAAWLQAA